MMKEKKPASKKAPSIWIAYIGEVVSILLFLTLGQILIQLVLLGQHNTSVTATRIHTQELKSQKILRNAILLYSLDPKARVQPIRELDKDIPAWEASHVVLDSTVFTTLPAAQRNTINRYYSAMDNALHAMLDDEKKHFSNPKGRLIAENPQLGIVFYNEIANITALDVVYTNINARADSLNTLTRIIEIALYLLAVAFLALGYLLVIRPARKQEQTMLSTLHSIVDASSVGVAQQQAASQIQEQAL